MLRISNLIISEMKMILLDLFGIPKQIGLKMRRKNYDVGR